MIRTTNLVLLLMLTILAPAGAADILVKSGQKIIRIRLHLEINSQKLEAIEADLLQEGNRLRQQTGRDVLKSILPENRLLRLETGGESSHSQRLTRALFAALDRNGDGKVSHEELLQADTRLLQQFDADEDDCLTALEIDPDLLNGSQIPPEQSKIVKLQFLTASQKKEAEDGPEAVLDIPWRFGKTGVFRQVHAGMVVDLAEFLPPIEEPILPKAFLAPGREAEMKLVERALASRVTLHLSSQPHGWFERLDRDGDGALSILELRQAWDLLADAGAKKRGYLTLPNEEPTVTLTLLSGWSGPPTTLLRRIDRPRSGPDWFQAMDRNRDGVISRREFLGTAAEFTQFDTDGDGFLSAMEAGAIDRKFLTGGQR